MRVPRPRKQGYTYAFPSSDHKIPHKYISYLITIESNISSAPARGLLANTGGIETTSDAFTSLNPLSRCFRFLVRVFVSWDSDMDGMLCHHPSGRSE